MTTPLWGDNGSAPTPQVGALPAYHTPIIARHAPGPFIADTAVIPSEQRWLNARTYLVTDADGQEYRALRVYDGDGEFLGYWAIELMPPALDLGAWETEHTAAVNTYVKDRRQRERDARRKRYGRHHD